MTVSHWPLQDYTAGEYSAAIKVNFNRQWGGRMLQNLDLPLLLSWQIDYK